MHEQKGIVIAVAAAVLGFAHGASAQKDAAEKAREGGIEHWIEYYKAERRLPDAPAAPRQETAPPEAGVQDRRSEGDATAREEALRK